MEWIKQLPSPTNHSSKVWKNNDLISGMFLSLSSKWRTFRSLQRHQITQWGTTLQTTSFLLLPKLPIQPLNRSSTMGGITHCTPNTIDQSSRATEQCKNIRSTLSPLLLQKQHQLMMIRLRLQRLSMVRTFPKVPVQEKKATRGGTLVFHKIFHGKMVEVWGLKCC